MNCIWNHCHEQITMDIAVIVYYALAVILAIVFALLSRSKTIQSVTLMIAGVWLFSLLFFLTIGGPRYFLFSALLDSALAYQFWRMSKREIFPAVLCCFLITDVASIFIAPIFSVPEFWTLFTLNRIFEFMLIYIIGASIYRIRKLEPPIEDNLKPSDGSLKFLAG